VSAALDLVLRHNVWANRALLEFCARLDRTTLDRATPGTYGTLRSTIQHIVSGEQWYLWILSGERIGTTVDENVPLPLEDLISIATRTGERAIALAATDDADRRVTVDGKPWSAGIIYAQLVHHGNEHRGQAKSILGANGIEPPGVSAWGYATDDRKTSWAES
jgi:uncharacterized damage-inducible protein DinB